MAGLASSSAIPVWLGEDDLSCIICHGLLVWPTTLPCGHSFCRDCLGKVWGAGGAGSPWACPTCREALAPRSRLRKNTLLEDLVDKYSRAARELEDAELAQSPAPGPGPAPDSAPDLASQHRPAQPRVAVQKSTTEVMWELTEVAQELVDIVKNLQNQRALSETGIEKESSILGMAPFSGEELSLASMKRMTSNTSEGKMSNILRHLKEIQEKLRGHVTWKEGPAEHTQVDLLESPSSSSCPLPVQSCPAPRRASRFAPWTINPTFDLRSLSCSLEVSSDCRTVTVSRCPQPYPWSPERFSVSQALCSQALSSGRQYWEVDTRYCNHWAVGVASWGMSRDQMLGRTTDSWCIEWRGTGQFDQRWWPSGWTLRRGSLPFTQWPVRRGFCMSVRSLPPLLCTLPSGCMA
ncbi:E3 ubiquitin-protein ligase RNF135 isoform X2 [Castor canadensis]|uniref:E3 ubiquitin-protein ligase RNF135 isoform X2 n=1 Tax=Castor canadensis TaxID=51338 RepID=A0AC58KC79_CASCN